MQTAAEALANYEAFAARNTPVLDAAEVRLPLTEILEAINSAGGRIDVRQRGYAEGWTDALDAAETTVRQLYVRKLAGK